MSRAAATDTPATGRIDAVVARAGYMMWESAALAWSLDQAAAWEGLLEVARVMRREAEALIEVEHDLTISMLGIMGRLGCAPQRTLRQTDLAAAMGLSLSRISRVIDILEARGLVERCPCPADARATNVMLTATGQERTTAAQQTIFTHVGERFVGRLSTEECATLARVFTRLLSEHRDDAPAAEVCGG